MPELVFIIIRRGARRGADDGENGAAMNDCIDVYTVVGAMMLLLFIFSEGYGVGPLGVFSSATGLFVGAGGASVIPGALLLLLILSFAFSSNLQFRDVAAIAVVILFIVLSVNI